MMGSAERPQEAINNFTSARRKAAIQSVLARLSGDSRELLSYDEVRQKLHAVESSISKLEVIPLTSIIGSVGRYNDFNRMFQPLKNSTQSRWIGVKTAIDSMKGVPPIEVYRIGEAYFVKDGNHRVSVARELGFDSIEAYVTDVHTTVEITPDLNLDELIIKSEQAQYLEKTRLHLQRPETDFTVTVPGKYKLLLEHIDMHKYFMGLDEKRNISYQEAVTHWHDEVYLAVLKLIKERGLFQDFPERSKTDLYLWMADHRAQLNHKLGWDLDTSAITRFVSEEKRPKSRLQTLQSQNPSNYLVDDILVAISGTDLGWQALEQAIVIAAKEQIRIYAVHAVASKAYLESDSVKTIKEKFNWRVAEAGVNAQLAFEVGSPVDVVSKRARYADIVIANLAHPPTSGLGLSAGFQPFIRRTPRSVLAVPGVISPLTKAIVAYDGSSKAEIALFATAVVATRWQIPVTVVSINEFGRDAEKLLAKARSYLETFDIKATYLATEGVVAKTLLEVVEQEKADLLLVGGYEYSSLLEPILGGVLDEVLRQSKVPMFICQ